MELIFAVRARREYRRTPEVLVITLKRFSNGTRKIERFVDFPLDGLDLAPFSAHAARGDTSKRYRLFAVTNHYGSSGYGHYTAFARDVWSEPAGSWYRYDDSAVTPVDEDDVRSPAAYVLFYARANGAKALS